MSRAFSAHDQTVSDTCVGAYQFYKRFSFSKFRTWENSGLWSVNSGQDLLVYYIIEVMIILK